MIIKKRLSYTWLDVFVITGAIKVELSSSTPAIIIPDIFIIIGGYIQIPVTIMVEPPIIMLSHRITMGSIRTRRRFTRGYSEGYVKKMRTPRLCFFVFGFFHTHTQSVFFWFLVFAVSHTQLVVIHSSSSSSCSILVNSSSPFLKSVIGRTTSVVPTTSPSSSTSSIWSWLPERA